MESEKISVIKLNNILLVTVPSDPEDDTVTVLQEKILEAMERHQTRGLILDISTVETMDSFFSRVIAETAQMVKLMGGKTIIAGMRPSVAITTTQLGLTMKNAMTALNMDQALEALNKMHSGIRR
jgi:rsbT antagonist protein RsbS